MSKLTAMRRKRGLRSAELARLVGVSRQNVCQAEKKGLRNMAAAVRYAKALNCEWQELLG